MTFAEAKTALADHAPAAKLESRINRALERLINTAKFVGTVRKATVTAFNGAFATPRDVRSVLGARVCNVGLLPANRYFEFIPGRYCIEDYSSMYRDLGHSPIFRDRVYTQYYKATGLTGSESVTVTYRNANGTLGRETLTAGSPQGEISGEIVRIAKTLTTNPILINDLSDEDGTVSMLIAVLNPGQTESDYRRYTVDSLVSTTDLDQEHSVELLCKLKHVELVTNTDLMPITNLSGLALALDSLQAESVHDYGLSEAQWQRALRIFNEEQASEFPIAVPPVRLVWTAGRPLIRAPH